MRPGGCAMHSCRHACRTFWAAWLCPSQPITPTATSKPASWPPLLSLSGDTTHGARVLYDVSIGGEREYALALVQSIYRLGDEVSASAACRGPPAGGPAGFARACAGGCMRARCLLPEFLWCALLFSRVHAGPDRMPSRPAGRQKPGTSTILLPYVPDNILRPPLPPSGPRSGWSIDTC